MRVSRRRFLSGAGGVGVLAGLSGGWYWSRTQDSNIQPQEIDASVGDDALHIGVLGDSHWRSESRMRFRGVGANSIVGSDELKRNLDVFMEDMNEVFEADFVVQLGDFVDGAEVGWNKQLRNLASAISYLEEGLDSPVHHLLGNHEYAYAGDEDLEEMYNQFGWDEVQDTWRREDIGGITAFFLNTAVSETPRSDDITDHSIPEEQRRWLKSQVERTENPVISFAHVPLTGGDGTPYDSTAGSDSVLNTFEKMDHRLGVFGHSHHAVGWNRLRTQDDPEGRTHINVPTPNALLPKAGHEHSVDDWMHIEYGAVPYLKLIVESDGSWTAYASYHGQGYDVPTVWRGE